MTVATKFHNYQRDGGGDPGKAYAIWDAKGWTHESPAIDTLKDYVLKRWGGQDLGSFGSKRRTVRGGSTPSTHGAGAAWDWRYAPAGSPRPDFMDEVFDLAISHSEELGIQMIADYYGCRIWKADRSSDVNGGWKTQTPSNSGMGKMWANWLHWEIHPDAWDDGRDVLDKIGVDQAPVFDPAAGQWSVWPLAAKPTIRKGAQGDAVRYLQGVMKLKANQSWLRVDGGFGNLTRQSVLNVQRVAGIYRDGVVGPQTWKVIDRLATS